MPQILPAVAVADLVKDFKGFRAVDGVSFTVPPAPSSVPSEPDSGRCF